jgi:hypothetical protein
MRITSKDFWDAVLCKLVETAISVKIWILIAIFYFVTKLFSVCSELRTIMLVSTTELQKIQILCSLQGKLYDIATSLIISGMVVIVLSRVTFQHARLNNSYHKEINKSQEIQNDFM